MSETETMVERVARAIYEARAVHFGEPPRNPPVRDERWELCISYARAAIAAMRTPTEEMVAEGAGVDFWNSGDGKSTTGNVVVIWPAMIEAALKEETP